MTHKHGYTLIQFIAFAGLVAFLGVMLFLTYQRSQANASALATERFLQQVRAEQEARCEYGRNYAVYTHELSVFSKPTDPHIRYDLSSGVGIMAINDQYVYALTMPSYADGRICCDNCEQLRTKYPPCKVLKKTYDYLQVKNDCSILLTHTEPEDTPSVQEKQPQRTDAASRPLVQSPDEEPSNRQAQARQQDEAEPVLPQASEAQPNSATKQPQAQAQQPVQDRLNEPSVLQEEPTACTSGEKGLFYNEPCSTYMAGAQGTVLFSWNQNTCKYDAVQNCSLPALWEKIPEETHAYPDVYPSDVEQFCKEILENSGCEDEVIAQVKKGRKMQCPMEEGTTCYRSCSIKEKTPVQQTEHIVLYDLKVSLEKLHCRPAHPVQVKIP